MPVPSVQSHTGQPATSSTAPSADEIELFNSALLDALQQKGLQQLQMSFGQGMEMAQDSVED